MVCSDNEMAERQQTPPEFDGMSLEKIIEAMAVDLENSSTHYAQFHGTSSQSSRPPTWGDYPLNQSRNDSRNQSIHQSASVPSMNPVSPSVYTQDLPAYTNNPRDPSYFNTETGNHLGINHNNDLIGAIDIGGGNYINLIYGNTSQIVSEQHQSVNLTSYNNGQGITDREYGLFNDQRVSAHHHSTLYQSTNSKHLIDNLVGNWVPNQSGTYSPFGSSSNVTPVPHTAVGIHEEPVDLPKKAVIQQQHRKPRIVAEVKPMRPSYSAVLTKSAPPLSSHLTLVTAKLSSDTLSKKVSGKNLKNKSKPGLLKRQNSTGSDDHGSPKIQIPKKSLEKNNSNLSRRWVSLDNLGMPSDSHVLNLFNRSDQFEKRRTNKTLKKSEKSETLNNSKIPNGNAKSPVNVPKRPIQINNNLNNSNDSNQITASEKIEKNQQTNNKSNKDDKKLSKEKSSKRSHVEKAQQMKKGQKNRKRDNREAPGKELYKNINKYANRWCKVGLKVFYWLLHLISDVVSMSTNLVIQFIKCMWFHIVLYLKYSWVYIASTFAKISIFNAIGKKIDNLFGNSWFAFWRRIMSPKIEKEGNANWMQMGLEANIALPSTGEEAMKRLLACKGKDPYDILGVTPTCSDDDIKKYYKRQAFLVHPDKNSQPGAEEAFKILVHAFDIIGEPGRREAFDQTRQVEAAWGELSDLLSQLHRKMEQAANTIRCTNCGLRHKRIPTQRPCYAARFCAQCKIRHSAKEGDIWAESRVMGFLWHYYACMEGAVYDVTDWAACQAGNLKHLRANTHSVQYRIVLGQRPSTQMSNNSNKKRQHTDPNVTDADLEDFLNNLYSHNKSGSSTTTSATTTEQSSTRNDNRRRKPRRK